MLAAFVCVCWLINCSAVLFRLSKRALGDQLAGPANPRSDVREGISARRLLLCRCHLHHVAHGVDLAGRNPRILAVSSRKRGYRSSPASSLCKTRRTTLALTHYEGTRNIKSEIRSSVVQEDIRLVETPPTATSSLRSRLPA
jgi:hypothetical protein